MSERRLPPSPRRLELARRAGVVAHSPSLTSAAAWCGAAAAIVFLAPAHAAALRAELLRAFSNQGSLPSRFVSVGLVTVGLAAPILVAAAAAALLAHFAQVRALWLPRRQLPGAPAAARSSRSAALGAGAWAVGRAALLAIVATAFVMSLAPALAALWRSDTELLPGAAALVAAALFALGAAWAFVGAVDLVGRSAARWWALRMTDAEARQEAREHQAASLARRRRASPRVREVGEASKTLAGASVLVVGEEHAAAVRWDRAAGAEPLVTLTRRGAAVSYALALARRAAVPIVRAPALARQLAEATPVAAGARVPSSARRELAHVVAALGEHAPRVPRR